MLIPISILWNVRVPLRKKVAFIGLFSLTIITIVVAIVRAVNITSTRQGTGQEDTTFLWLWSAIQAPLGEISPDFRSSRLYDLGTLADGGLSLVFFIAVIVACLSSFPQLFSGQGAAKQKPVWTPTDTYYQRLKSRMKATSKNSNTPYDLPTVASTPDHPQPEFESNRSLGRDQYAPSFDSLELEPEVSEEIQRGHPQQPEKAVVMAVPVYHGPAAVELEGHLNSNSVSPSPAHGIHITRKISYSVTQEPTPVHHQIYRGYS